MTERQQKPLQHLRTTFREYVTHWAVAGAIVTTTGFAPDHWVAHVLHEVPSGLRQVFPSGIDYRLVLVFLGVLIIVADVVLRNQRRLRLEVPATTSSALIDSRPVAIGQLAQSDKQSIAVLPFNNLSNDPDQVYFAEGLTASLTTDLSRISGLFVIASTTAATFVGKIIDNRQIGRDLGVRYVLQGSVQRGSDRLRVNAQLTDSATGVQLWSDRFDGSETDMFALQDQITARIANSIGRELNIRAARDAEKRKMNPQAIDFLIRGMVLADKPHTLEGLLEQEKLFRKALALDPNNSDAWARLGRAILLQRLNFAFKLLPEQKDEKLREGRKAVEMALALDRNSAHAHLAEGVLYRVLGNNAESARANEAAIALDRNLAVAHAGVGIALIYLGEPEKAMPWIEQAMLLDPFGPSIGIQQANMGKIYLLQRRSDLAIEWFLKARASMPGHARIHGNLAAAYAQKGDDAAVRLTTENLLRLAPSFKCSDDFPTPGSFSSEAYRTLYEQIILPAYMRTGMPI